MATGRVLQFDHDRGYGFIAADDGGDDVFLHTSVLDDDIYEPRPGMRLQFKIMAGDRGRKAFAVHLLPDDKTSAVPAPRPAAPLPAPVQAPVIPAAHQSVAPTAPDAVTSDASAPAALTSAAVGPDDDDPTCDVLSPDEFRRELTELLLDNVPALTGQQILEVRTTVLESARKHGWIDF